MKYKVLMMLLLLAPVPMRAAPEKEDTSVQSSTILSKPEWIAAGSCVLIGAGIALYCAVNNPQFIRQWGSCANYCKNSLYRYLPACFTSTSSWQPPRRSLTDYAILFR